MRKLILSAFMTLPVVAYADERMTYRCSGTETTDAGNPIHELKRVTSYFTLYFSGSSGRYFDWDSNGWAPIQALTDRAFVLYDGQSGPALHAYGTMTIDRRNGGWKMSYAGGGGSVSTAGKCVRVALRQPESAKK